MAAICDETKFFFENWDYYSAETLWVKNWRDKIFFENWHYYSAEIPYGSKISLESLSLARFSRYEHFCVLQFLRKIWKFKLAAIFGETNFFWKLGRLLCRDTLWVKNFFKIVLSLVFFEIQASLHFEFEIWVHYCAEMPRGSKILPKSLYLARFSRYNNFCVLQDVRIFPFPAKVQDGRPRLQKIWIFLYLGIWIFYSPVGQKFARNSSNSYSFWDICIFSFPVKIQDGPRKNNPINMQWGNMIVLYPRKLHTKF